MIDKLKQEVAELRTVVDELTVALANAEKAARKQVEIPAGIRRAA